MLPLGSIPACKTQAMLILGQVARNQEYREAFQEADYLDFRCCALQKCYSN